MVFSFLGVCALNVVATPNTKEISTTATYFRDGGLVTINVIEYRSGRYQCTRILTAQYHSNDDLGFIHIGSTNQTMQINHNPYYGKVNDLRATYKYVAGNNYYIVNP